MSMSDRATNIVRAATELDRELQDLRTADRSRLEALHTWRDRATAAESEAKIVRADLEALQAAVRGLTGKKGAIADMVSDLADVGRSKDVAMVAALRRDRDDARRGEARAVDTLVTARELFIALRAAVQSERSWAASLPGWERLARALRGEKDPQEPESKPVHVAGPWIEIAPGEWRRRVERSPMLFAASIGPHTSELLIWIAQRPEGGVFSERNTTFDLRAAMDACDAALVRAGWTLLNPTPAKDPQTVAIEAVAATVESVSNNMIALEQQIAEVRNALAEVQDPAWFATRFREYMRPKPVEARPAPTDGCDDGHPGCSVCDVASVAQEQLRVSWKWADGKTAGWLTTATGEQIAGAHEGGGGWYWWSYEPLSGTTGHVGPMAERVAIESAEAAARIQGAVIVQ